MARPHDNNLPEASQQIAHLADITHTIERRLLHLVKQGTQRAIPPEDIESELGLLVKEVERCYRRIADIQDRRDVGFKAETRLKDVGRHCLWLHRRIHVEQSFFRRWHLETKLRALISAEAFGVYQEILDAEQLGREYLMRGDAEIARLMREASGPRLDDPVGAGAAGGRTP